jgi:hypothetical protein
MRTKLISAAATVTILLIAAPTLSRADTYTEATFSGAIFGGNANVQPPFSGNGFNQGDTFTGAFVFDNQLVPNASSGLTNVAFTDFPAIAQIPAVTAFSFDLDGLALNLSNEFTGDEAAIQYNNGAFNGFSFLSDFAFKSNEYQFLISGGTFSVVQVDANGNPIPLAQTLISGFINIGNSALTGEQAYTPPAPVPLPPSLGMLGASLAGLLLIGRRRSKRATPIAA